MPLIVAGGGGGKAVFSRFLVMSRNSHGMMGMVWHDHGGHLEPAGMPGILFSGPMLRYLLNTRTFEDEYA